MADCDEGKRKLEQRTVENMCRGTVYPIEFKMLCHGTGVIPPGIPGHYLDRPHCGRGL